MNEKVLDAAGGLSGLDYWLLNYGGGSCQYDHSDYHYHELTIMHHEPGSILLCGYCDNQLREQHTDALAELARRNVIAFVLDSVRNLSRHRQKPRDLPRRTLLVGCS
ncbi:Putative cytoplasmic protein [Enterobacter cancerogenus]|uniref:Cytoplasmic protein n=1 Tax=Enterobacter cancerogenus TaxID=69218 RepID=A0A484X8D6_9ENTR|nr:Putative cytoplasmic protein [Enterobacter cancerogenus]